MCIIQVQKLTFLNLESRDIFLSAPIILSFQQNWFIMSCEYTKQISTLSWRSIWSPNLPKGIVSTLFLFKNLNIIKDIYMIPQSTWGWYWLGSSDDPPSYNSFAYLKHFTWWNMENTTVVLGQPLLRSTPCHQLIRWILPITSRK